MTWGSHDTLSATGVPGVGLLPREEAAKHEPGAARTPREAARAGGVSRSHPRRRWRALRTMSARAVKSICLVGVADVAYRVFLRGYVRRRVGVETRATHR